VLRVPADTVNHRRRHGIKKVQADEVQPRFVGHDSAVVYRLPILSEDRKVDPGKAGMEPGTPDHVLYLEDTAVLQQRQSVSHAYDSRYPLDTGRG